MKFWKSKLVCALNLVLLVFLTGCPKNVQVQNPSSDNTPPVTKLDIYGVPLPPNVGTGNEDLTGITSKCCTASRRVPLDRKIDFVASGEDTDGGVRQLSIIGEVYITCSLHGSETLHRETVTIGKKPDTTVSGTTAPTLLIAQGSIKLEDYWNGACGRPLEVPSSLKVEIVATTENFNGGIDKTQTVTLFYPNLRP